MSETPKPAKETPILLRKSDGEATGRSPARFRAAPRHLRDVICDADTVPTEQVLPALIRASTRLETDLSEGTQAQQTAALLTIIVLAQRTFSHITGVAWQEMPAILGSIALSLLLG